ncbi:TetR/AcrR family transcriptional regulator [Dactylosporangium sp. NPDC048998]|uniref:TetR/AcrR family transcriptional regulator n=1 Tax=Dactylosporangium sp. NPDC048998 TaxID=3363976 RepID=UPI00371024A4
MSARRDPEGRKRALAAAVVEVVAEVGVGRTTHRMVAARAGVPLGATTYYFPTLGDLIAAGLALVSDSIACDLDAWREAIYGNAAMPVSGDTGAREDAAGALSRLVGEYVADQPKALLEYELYLAAARAPALRPLARAWLDGVHELLAPVMGDAGARAVSALIDGAMLQAVVTGDPIDPAGLAAAIRCLTPDAHPSGDHEDGQREHEQRARRPEESEPGRGA